MVSNRMPAAICSDGLCRAGFLDVSWKRTMFKVKTLQGGFKMNRDAWQLKMKKVIHEKMHHIGKNFVAIHKSQRKKNISEFQTQRLELLNSE